MTKEKTIPTFITKEEVESKANEHMEDSSEIKSVVMSIYDPRTGKVRKEEYDSLCMNEEYWCERGWDQFGLKWFGERQSYSNVTAIEFKRYKRHKTVTITEIDPVTNKAINSEKIKIGI